MYQQIMTRLTKLMDVIARHLMLSVFTIIFLASFIIKPMYSFDDLPYFSTWDLYDICAMAAILILCLILIKNRIWLQNALDHSVKCFGKSRTLPSAYMVCFLIYMTAAAGYILLVPLTPFSDMASVCRGALNFSQFEWEKMLLDPYWTIFPGNIKLAAFWGCLLIPFPKSLVTLKILNALFAYAIIALTRELARAYRIRYYNLVYLLLLTFLPLFLYINHIYYDLPVVMLCTLSLYLYKKKGSLMLSSAILGLAQYLRNIAALFMLALIIVCLLETSATALRRSRKTAPGRMIVSVLIFCAISCSLSKGIEHRFIEENFKSYPAWNQIYIGINEPKLGFMDGDFSYDRDAGDVAERIRNYGPVRFTALLAKKTFWLWSQGTYQAQRYAFGNDAASWEEKFEYRTILTGRLLNDHQTLRRTANAFMHAQYLLLFGMMLFTFFHKTETDRFRLFYYIIAATFLIMLIYELKSRYILHLLPIMTLLAGNSIEYLKTKE